MNTSNQNSTEADAGNNIFITYTAIIIMALVPIWTGSFMSMSRKRQLEAKGEVEEKMTKRDAYMFPLIGSAFLLGLYILFRLFSKEHVNMLLACYFLLFGYISFFQSLAPVFAKLLPSLNNGEASFFSYRLPWETTITSISLTWTDVTAAVVSFALLLWYSFTKHWIANNILGLAFSVQGVATISLPSYQVGCILLGGLFLYDIFWVFGTDVMVTVAKSFDAPIKLLFPKNLLAAKYQFSMLGLGDIVIPGIFVALLLRYDAHRALRQGVKTGHFSKPFFLVTFIGYAIGLISTIVVMHTFQAAQPALLYLVPCVIGFSAVTAIILGEFDHLVAFEAEETIKSDKKDKSQ